MKSIKYICFLILFFVGFSCKVLQQPPVPDIHGTYIHKSIHQGYDYYDYYLTLSDSNTFTLYRDNTTNHPADWYSCYGEWSVSNDTLFLKNSKDINNIVCCLLQGERERFLLIRGDFLVLENGHALRKQIKDSIE